MTMKCKQNLCELITKYYYENYDHCSLYRKDIIINHFMYDFIWSTRIDSSNADYHDISHLENDIISTFTMILYGKSNSKAPWWKKNIRKLLKKQNQIFENKRLLIVYLVLNIKENDFIRNVEPGSIPKDLSARGSFWRKSFFGFGSFCGVLFN